MRKGHAFRVVVVLVFASFATASLRAFDLCPDFTLPVTFPCVAFGFDNDPTNASLGLDGAGNLVVCNTGPAGAAFSVRWTRPIPESSRTGHTDWDELGFAHWAPAITANQQKMASIDADVKADLAMRCSLSTNTTCSSSAQCPGGESCIDPADVQIQTFMQDPLGDPPVDCDGTLTPGPGTCAPLEESAQLIAVGTNNLDFNNDGMPDGNRLCTDNLVATPTCVGPGNGSICGSISTPIIGNSGCTANITVNSSWAFRSTDDAYLDNGEQLYMDADPAGEWFSGVNIVIHTDFTPVGTTQVIYEICDCPTDADCSEDETFVCHNPPWESAAVHPVNRRALAADYPVKTKFSAFWFKDETAIGLPDGVNSGPGRVLFIKVQDHTEQLDPNKGGKEIEATAVNTKKKPGSMVTGEGGPEAITCLGPDAEQLVLIDEGLGQGLPDPPFRSPATSTVSLLTALVLAMGLSAYLLYRRRGRLPTVR